MMGESIHPVTRRTLHAIRENISTSLSGVLRGSASVNRYTVLNRHGEVLSDRSGTWSIDLANAVEVSENFDAALVGGDAVASFALAREVITARLQGELDLIEGNLQVT